MEGSMMCNGMDGTGGKTPLSEGKTTVEDHDLEENSLSSAWPMLGWK